MIFLSNTVPKSAFKLTLITWILPALDAHYYSSRVSA